jgi:hypothetical protein
VATATAVAAATAVATATACLAETRHHEDRRPCQEQRAKGRECFLKHVVPPSVEPISISQDRLPAPWDAWANGTGLSLGNARLGP